MRFLEVGGKNLVVPISAVKRKTAIEYPIKSMANCERFRYVHTIEYRDLLKGVQILLSNSQSGPGRKVKQEQEEISRNHVQAF